MHAFDDFGSRARLVGLDRRTVVIRSTSPSSRHVTGSVPGR